MRISLFSLAIVILLAACTAATEPTSAPDSAVTSPPQGNMNTSEPSTNPLFPQPGDDKFERGNVFIEESGIVIRESYPPQISLMISGNLPTPCHQLRAVVGAPENDNKINVEVYTVVDPNTMCTQVLKPFSESIDLGKFPAGHYSVWVNGESVGEFDS